jgi:activating signal cointegrator 1
MTMIRSITIIDLLEETSKESVVEDRCLSIKNPWLELILSSKKDIEVRTWTTKYRGPIWLHAGKSLDKSQLSRWNLKDLDTGAYLGKANLVDVIEFTPKTWESLRKRHLNEGPFQSGLYGWVFEKPTRLKQPLTAPGKLGLYRPDADLLSRLNELL